MDQHRSAGCWKADQKPKRWLARLGGEDKGTRVNPKGSTRPDIERLDGDNTTGEWHMGWHKAKSQILSTHMVSHIWHQLKCVLIAGLHELLAQPAYKIVEWYYTNLTYKIIHWSQCWSIPIPLDDFTHIHLSQCLWRSVYLILRSYWEFTHVHHGVLSGFLQAYDISYTHGIMFITIRFRGEWCMDAHRTDHPTGNG